MSLDIVFKENGDAEKDENDDCENNFENDSDDFDEPVDIGDNI